MADQTGTPSSGSLQQFAEQIKHFDLRTALDIAGLVASSSVVIALSYWLLFRLLPRFFPNIRSFSKKLGGLRIQRLTLVSPKQVGMLFISLLHVVQMLVCLVIAFIVIPLIWSVFPETEGFAWALLKTIAQPLAVLGSGILENLDNFLFIVVVAVVTRYLIVLLRKIFTAIGHEQIVFKSFDAEWATVTYQLVRLIVVALAVVVVIPYIPGSDSAVFRGVSLLLGVLMTLGSSSAMGNLVAGALLVYMRPFSVGDRVKIADTVGDVIARDLLVTRVQTIKNIEVTIPNATILGHHIVNYSASSNDPGIILHTSVTIGYEIPWRRVHAALVAAAAATPDILADPEPFVLQTDLGDFSVRYELNGFTQSAGIMARTLSGLHQNIQDHLFSAGIEILSPHYTALRDGRGSTIPKDGPDR